MFALKNSDKPSTIIRIETAQFVSVLNLKFPQISSTSQSEGTELAFAR
jgi:hypothetical protein